MEKKKIYLSGKISGDPHFKEKFAQKAKELTEKGFQVYNPTVHPDMFSWEEFMELDLLALSKCDSIYLLDDWKDSRGAKIEYDEAVRLGKEVLYDKERNKNIEQPDVKIAKTSEEYRLWLEATTDFSSEQIDRMVNKVAQSHDDIKAEVVELKSFKYRVTLDDGSLTPWQYIDHVPSQTNMADAKRYYTKLKEKSKEDTVKLSSAEPSNKKGIRDPAPVTSFANFKKQLVEQQDMWPEKSLLAIAKELLDSVPLSKKKEVKEKINNGIKKEYEKVSGLQSESASENVKMEFALKVIAAKQRELNQKKEQSQENTRDRGR